MIIEDIMLTLSKEAKIKLTIAKPNDLRKARAVILINHGMAEHSDRYFDFIKLLTSNNYIVYAHDHRGHKGSINSPEDYGFIDSKDCFKDFVNDNLEIVNLINETYPSLEIFMIGHSMGSFITQRFLQLYGNKVKGAIIAGSARHNKFKLSLGILYAKILYRLKGKRHRSKTIDNMMFGAFSKKFNPNRTRFDWLNTDEAEVDKYIKDPYCGGVFTTGFYRDFFRGLKRIQENYELVPKDISLYIISGDHDPVGGFGKNVIKLFKTYEKNNITDLNIKLYPNARHELFLEANKEEVMNDCILWLNERTK